MDQFCFDARLEASPLINELVSTLTEVKRTLDEVNRKAGSLFWFNQVRTIREDPTTPPFPVCALRNSITLVYSPS